MSINNGRPDAVNRDMESGPVEIREDTQQTAGSMAALQAVLANQGRQGISPMTWPSPFMQFTKARLRLADWCDRDEE